MKTFLAFACILSSSLLSEECCFLSSARPYPEECWGFSINIDPILWQARMGGLGVVIQTKDSTDFFNSAGQSRVQNLNYNWDWGFRLGLGLHTTHDAWDILLQWTSWCTEAARDFVTKPGEANFPHFGHPDQILGTSAEKVKSKWNLRYNTLDLEGARDFWIGQCLSLRPFGGLRSAWIDQKEFSLDLENLSLPSLYTDYSILQSDRFWGLGIRAGLDMRWELAWGFSLFNNFAGNLLYSFHSVKHKEKGNGEELFDVTNFFHVGSSIFDMQIGIAYDWFSCDCCYHLGLSLGWELHFYPAQNQFMLFVDDTMPGKFVSNQGDFGIQGFYLKVRFDF